MTTTATRPAGPADNRSGRARAAIAAKTLRTDRWWFPPLVTFVGLTAWLAYGLVRVYMHRWYYVEEYHYLTPFYSPCITERCVPEAAHFGTFLPAWWIIPEAALTLPFLLLFRLTCYYYRKAYYRSFWFSPPACAVGEPHRSYTGESKPPLLVQNLHRYALYGALVFNVILTYDAILGFRDETGEWGHMGLGTLVLLANAALLWGYSLSCHSCRHIVGGRLNHFSRHPLRYKLWTQVSKLNAMHAKFAWLSLFSVMIADLYVFLLATGTISDLRFF
jgi:hypothetical protein